MWIVDEIVRLLRAQTREQHQVSKALTALERSFRPEDAYAAMSMNEAIKSVRLEIIHDRTMVEALMQRLGTMPHQAAARLLLSEARKRLDEQRDAMVLVQTHCGLFAVEAYVQHLLQTGG